MHKQGTSSRVALHRHSMNALATKLERTRDEDGRDVSLDTETVVDAGVI